MEWGIAPLMHLIARRLARPLNPAEHRVLAGRLVSLGADRLGDVALDLPPGCLATWLADPDAT